MDALELARQAAAELHFQAVSFGRDPWKPYEFALAEAKRRDLDVEAVAPDFPLLNGGRAILDAGGQIILHENTGTVFDQAFLVAHEIGHAELGDNQEDEPVREIDPARSAEPSPIGIDRVIDYGRLQRREVQMDIFAREFLLPRTVARKLHLADKLTASEIAIKLGAPFDVVAQQLMDALLLPVITAGSKSEGADRPLNPLQDQAAGYRGKAYLLEAGPGTGKTQTLTSRVEGLLFDGIDPRRILVLTFSNKAAGEMAVRIARKHKHAAAAMWIGTFHAFGLDLIRRFHPELGLPKDPRMLDRTEAVEFLEQEFPRLGLVHYRDLYDPTQNIADILAAISRAKDEVVDHARYATLAQRMLDRAASDEELTLAQRAMEVARVYAAYESLKRQANCVDFGDLVLLPVQLLEGNDAIRNQLQSTYDHVLVDEYQDVNRSSVRLLTALRTGGENLWAVGDAKQSIYRFRGASSFNMARFGKEDFPSGERGRLKRNYRSVGEIVDTFSAFAVGMKVGDFDSGLESERGDKNHQPELRTVDQAEQQSVAVADAIEEMRQVGYSYRDQAVLCTGNEKLSNLGRDLERLGVPVLFLGSLFERPEVKDLFALLTLLTDRRATGLVRVACWPEFQMPMADVMTVLDRIRESQGPAGKWLHDPNALDGISPDGDKALASLASVLSGFNQQSSPWSTLATVLLDRTRIAATIAGSSEVADRTRGIAIWQLMNFVKAQPPAKGVPIVRLLDRVRRLVRLGDDRDLRQLPAAAQGIDAVRLMTIHGAKGLEFSVVHLPGLNADTIPRSAATPPCPPPDGMVEGTDERAVEAFKAGQVEEQECLFYVALSRAKDRLITYAPLRKSNRKAALSLFLAPINPKMISRKITPMRSLPADPEAAAVELLIDGSLRFDAHKVALYENCPRRFFYTHILQIGGRRTETAFMRMHEAVRTVFQGVISGEAPIASDQELENRVTEAFARNGLGDHGYAEDYKAFALGMVRFFISSRQGHTPEAPNSLRLDFGQEEIFVRPDEVLVGPDGLRTLRNIRTGHKPSSEEDDVAVAALLVAALKAFPNATVEMVYLSDQTVQPIGLSSKKVENRINKLNDFLQAIRSGVFPAERSSRRCPGCPSFFVCGPTPSGSLQRKF
jgi:superfamily I DNA/RNA helicase